MDKDQCNHNWKIHAGAKHVYTGYLPAIYICEDCGLTMGASDVIQIKLQNSIDLLREQISQTGGGVRQTMSVSIDKLSDSFDKLRSEIQKYSESSNKHSTAIKLLTAALVFVGIINIIIAFRK